MMSDIPGGGGVVWEPRVLVACAWTMIGSSLKSTTYADSDAIFDTTDDERPFFIRNERESKELGAFVL